VHDKHGEVSKKIVLKGVKWASEALLCLENGVSRRRENNRPWYDLD